MQRSAFATTILLSLLQLLPTVFTFSTSTSATFLSSRGAFVDAGRLSRPRPTLTSQKFRPRPSSTQRDVSSQPISESKSSKSSNGNNNNANVLYQKVLRPPPNMPDILFLGSLVEYLEEHFQIPNNLPMIYERVSEINLDTSDEPQPFLLAWDSPLSPSSDATKMEVEVIGVYTDGKTTPKEQKASTPSVPTMAMVVVRKARPTPSSALPPMMEGLFQDSEKRILKALDRGLEDFLAGKISLDLDESKRNPRLPTNVKTAVEAIEVEAVNEVPRRKAKIQPEEVILDTQATETPNDNNDQKKRDSSASTSQEKSSKAAPTPEQIAAARASMQVKAAIASQKSKRRNAKSKTNRDTNEDFAVAAARRKAAKGSSPKGSEDFAVAAARKIAARQNPSKATKTKVKGSAKTNNNSKPKSKDVTLEPVSADPMSAAVEGFKVADYMGDQRAFRTTISRPRQRNTAKSTATPTPIRTTNVTSSTSRQVNSSRRAPKEATPPTPKSKAQSKIVKDPSPTDKLQQSIEGRRKLNVKVMNDDTALQPNSLSERVAREQESENYPSDEQLQVDVMKAAQDAMNEIAEESSDMTPEELLKDVLKFGDEQEKENQAGSGFVSGAFEKAKDLMKEQHRQRQVKIQQQELGFKEPSPVDDILPNVPLDPEEFSETEELRRMFEAGERLAEGRITEAFVDEDGPLANTGTTEKDVDELIANERSISGYARVLDDELAELELSINPTPGEELDGPQRNPLFDIMSGPEVYNPNVELDAVNYPGALPGTKEVKLPKDLSEAIKQAEFAVDVLTKLETVEKSDANGNIRASFVVGKKELDKSQVDNLQAVVAEAVEIGLIPDPVTLLAEQSRLQMIIDELWNQPEERFQDIAESYKDLILSDNFVNLLKDRLLRITDRDLDALRQDDEKLKADNKREREILGQLVVYAQVLLKEARALGAQLEAQQLEIVRSICQVAMDPRHETEEETATALTDAVRDMRPLLDDVFVAYLKYAVAEEEGRLARAGLLDDPEHNQWLFVLQIVQQGVYAEIAKGINRHVEHIWYVLRMDKASERRQLLSRLIDDMPTMDVRPFVKVVDNIVGALGDSTRGEFEGVTPLGEMTNALLQLHRDVKELLPPERIAEKSRDADEWAAKQKQRLLEARQAGQKRLQASRDVAGRQDEVDALERRGEIERIE